MVEGSVGACHGGPYGVGAALRTASMSSARASASASPMAISAFRYSGCRACGAGIRGCRRDDRACWPDVREEQPATPAGRPGSDRVRGHPHRHIAALLHESELARPWESSATPTSRTTRSDSSGPRAPPAAGSPISPPSSAAPAAADEPEAQRLSRAVRVLNCPCCGFVLRTECLPLLAHSEHAVVVAAGIDIIPP